MNNQNETTRTVNEREGYLKRLLQDLDERIYKLKHFDSEYQVNVHFDDLQCEIITTIESAIQHLNQVQVILLDKINIQRDTILDRETAPPQSYRSNESLQQDIVNLSSEFKEFSEKCLAQSSDLSSLEQMISEVEQQTSVYKDRISMIRLGLTKQAFKGRFVQFKKNNWFFLDEYLVGNLEPCEIDIKDARIETQVKLTRCTEFQNKGVSCVPIILGNGDVIISSDNSIKLWDKKTNELKHLISMPIKFVNVLLELSNGFLAVGDDRGKLLIIDMVNLCVVKSFRAHKCQITLLKLLQNGNLLTYSFDDNMMNIWKIGLNYEMKNLMNITALPMEWAVLLIAEVKGLIVIYGGTLFDLNLQIWDPKSAQIVRKQENIAKNFRCICALSDDEVAIAAFDGSIFTMDAQDFSKRVIFRGKSQTRNMAVLATGHLICEFTEQFYIIDPKTGDCLSEISVFSSPLKKDFNLDMAIANDRKSLLTQTEKNYITIWTLNS